MSRRANKSKKVPNVKLRPAPATRTVSLNNHRARSNPPDSFSFQDLNANDNTQYVDLCPRPFKNFVICATGVPDKTSLFKKALELGAMSTHDFTDRVTHLIAVVHEGAKYKCALERKIPIMSPEWIIESYEVWLRGDDVDLPESIAAHRIPIFADVVLTLSGIDDITKRTQINKFLTREGGTYVKQITRPVKVTHLLCAGEEVTDKMRYADKFNEKKEADIQVVWEEWFWDCLEFGGRFDEEQYKVTHPRPEKRRSSPEPPATLPPSSEPSSLSGDTPPPNIESKRIPDNSMAQDEDEEEIAQVKRIPKVTLQIWESLLKSRGFEITGDKLMRSPSRPRTQYHDDEDDAMRELETRAPISNNKKNKILDVAPDPKGVSLLSTFTRANSFAPLAPLGSVSGTAGRLFKRVPSAFPGPSSSFLQAPPSKSIRRVATQDNHGGPSQLGPQQWASSSSTNKMFSRLKFRLLGEARAPNVRAAIEAQGGRVIGSEDEDDVDFIIVRLISGSKYYRQETDENEKIKYRTECWLERCIYEERICTPEERVVFTPLKVDIPIPGAEDVNFSFSGLDESEACWVRRLLRALGVALAPNFSRRSTHLLCPSATGAKFEKAKEWGIPVVDMRWLEDIARTGAVPDVVGYSVVEGIGGFAGDEQNSIDMSIAILPMKDSKGKGKAREGNLDADVKMMDITNSATPENLSDQQPIPMGQTGVGIGPYSSLKDQDAQTDIDQEIDSQQMFGDPCALLCSPPGRNSDPPTTPPPPSKLAVQNHAPLSQPRSLKRKSRSAEIDAEQVPSSNTPSPLKNPRSGSVPGSPRKPSPRAEATKALQEKITSLLGKRPSEEEETLGHGRLGKRVRPHSRSKLQSRQNSGELPFPRAQSPVPFETGFNPLDAQSYDGMNLLDHNDRPAEENMRVTYEDPGQRAEKRRLLNLLDGDREQDVLDLSLDEDSVGKGKKKKNLVRRATRVAGF